MIFKNLFPDLLTSQKCLFSQLQKSMIGVRELALPLLTMEYLVIPVNTINTTIIKIAKCTKRSKGLKMTWGTQKKKLYVAMTQVDF